MYTRSGGHGQLALPLRTAPCTRSFPWDFCHTLP